MKVYILMVQTDYYSTEVHSVFSTKEEAIRVWETVFGQTYVDDKDGDILEKEILDRLEIGAPPQGKKWCEVEMGRNGKISFQRTDTPLTNGYGYDDEATFGQLRRTSITHLKWGDEGVAPWESRNYWRVRVFGYFKEMKEAIQLCDEMRLRLIAGERPAEVQFGEPGE